MFTLYQKRQFIYPDKLYNSLTNSPISFIFNFWSQDISHYHNFKAQEDLKTYLWGKFHSVLGTLEKILPIDRAHL